MEPIIDHIQITVRDPEYTPPGYYALFFKDLEGIKYEIVTHSQVGSSEVVLKLRPECGPGRWNLFS